MKMKQKDINKFIGKIKKQRGNFSLMLYTGIISFAAFYSVKVDTLLYLPVAVMLWMILLTNYRLDKNRIFYKKVDLTFLTNLAVYGTVKFLQCDGVSLRGIHVGYGAYGVALVLLFLFLEKENGGSVQAMKVKTTEQGEGNKNDLFRERVWDLERLIQLLETENLVGIDSPWGNGKTFLLHALERRPEIAEKYVFIEMNLLACNLDEIQTILLNELERVLSEHGIFSRYSRKLRGMLREQGVVFRIGSTLMDNRGTFSEMMAGLRQELEGLGKTVVVVYEDMDRIGDSRVVREILSIAENMSTGGIKTVFQYDEQKLKEMDAEFDHAYLNKFIHITMRLSEISFFSELSYLLETGQYGEWLDLEDFRYLTGPVSLDYNLSKLLGYRHTVYWEMQIQGATIRNVQLFLQEITAALQYNLSYQDKECRRDVITFYVMKHFMYDLYQCLYNMKGKRSLLDELTIKDEEKVYTLPEIVNFLIRKDDSCWSPEQVKKLIQEKENRRRVVIIQLFQYSLEIPEEQDWGKIGEMSDDILQRGRKQEKNERKDRLIQNLLYAGYSGQTNQRNAVGLFRKCVLEREEAERKQGFAEFWNKLYQGDFEKAGNQTIFYIGNDKFMDLFRTFWMADASEKDWLDFLSFYFQYGQVKEISAQLIENLNYCDLKYRSVYLLVLKKFNELEVIGNFNQLKSYWLFLKRYLRALSELDYMETYEVGGLERSTEIEKEGLEYLKQILEQMKKRLEERGEKLKKLPSLQEDIQLILTFLDKNRQVIENEAVGRVPEHQIKTSMRTQYIYQEEFERLRDFSGNAEEYWEEVDKSYREGRIGMHEILALPRSKSEAE